MCNHVTYTNQKGLQEYLDNGWGIEATSNRCGHEFGKFYVLRKEASCCERIAKCALGIICCPFLLIAEICCNGKLCDSDTECDRICVGYERSFKLGVLIYDHKKTSEMREKDCKALRVTSFDDLTGIIKYQISKGNEPIKSETCPQHYYLLLPPVPSGTAYNIIIPFNDYSLAQIHAAFHLDGTTQSSNERRGMAEDSCQAYNGKVIERINAKEEEVCIATEKVAYGTISVYGKQRLLDVKYSDEKV